MLLAGSSRTGGGHEIILQNELSRGVMAVTRPRGGRVLRGRWERRAAVDSVAGAQSEGGREVGGAWWVPLAWGRGCPCGKNDPGSGMCEGKEGVWEAVPLRPSRRLK